MVFLIDTNVWLERLLDQEKSKEVGELFDAIPSDSIIVSLDKDFDQTERGRKTPREVLQGQRG
jgi:predicted nucleic acid-binding protein